LKSKDQGAESMELGTNGIEQKAWSKINDKLGKRDKERSYLRE
jgi:hypothetical protein